MDVQIIQLNFYVLFFYNTLLSYKSIINVALNLKATNKVKQNRGSNFKNPNLLSILAPKKDPCLKVSKT